MYSKFEELLNEKGVTAYAVAKATGIPSSTFSDWKSGKSKPKIEKLQKIADFFNVSVTCFLEGGDSE
jgi:transcriptional regulator with XRE-family HTH domain